MIPKVYNLYGDSDSSGKESIETLISGRAFRLEHIVSRGDSSEPAFWYDQAEDEWVALVKGEARLAFEAGELALVPGDALRIPAHVRHRVAWTSADAVWLAIHLE